MLDREFLYTLYKTYRDDLASLTVFDPQLAALGRAYHKEARKILYMMVRHFAPDVIVEISPKRGLSTLHSALALEHNGRGQILSFELHYRSVAKAYANARRNGLGHRVRFFYGDAREEVPKVLRRLRARTGSGGIEFLFIDSDHGRDFARWYSRALFPYVRSGGVIHIDDILTDPRNAAARRTPLTLRPTGEEEEIGRVLLENREKYAWLSLADCVRDPAYLETVRVYGGGDVTFDEGPPAREVHRQIGFEWNPSLWMLNRGRQESDDVVDVDFPPIKRPFAKALRHAVRKRLFTAFR